MSDSAAFARLSPRQREVLTLMAQGLGRREIANRMGLAPETVRAHLSMAYARLGVTGHIGAFRVLGWLVRPTSTGA